jgi:hypothetical protein
METMRYNAASPSIWVCTGSRTFSLSFEQAHTRARAPTHTSARPYALTYIDSGSFIHIFYLTSQLDLRISSILVKLCVFC